MYPQTLLNPPIRKEEEWYLGSLYVCTSGSLYVWWKSYGFLPTTKRNGFGKEPKVEKRDVYIWNDTNAVPTPTPFGGDT